MSILFFHYQGYQGHEETQTGVIRESTRMDANEKD